MARFWAAQERSVPLCRVRVDCSGLLLSPGFVDLQINGAFGRDFSSDQLTPADVSDARRALLSHGVTAICPTMVSSSSARYARNVPLIAPHDSCRARDGCALLGAHLEGPFFCPRRKGAHDPTHITTPRAAAIPPSAPLAPTAAATQLDPACSRDTASSSTADDSRLWALPAGEAGQAPQAALDGLAEAALCAVYGAAAKADTSAAAATGRGDNGSAGSAARASDGSAATGQDDCVSGSTGNSLGNWLTTFLSAVRIVTLAPELPGSAAVASWLSSRGVLVSMGHSSATAEEGEAGIAAGATMVTHLFNAMSGFHHRDPGLVGLLGRQCSRSAAAPVGPLTHSLPGTDASSPGDSGSADSRQEHLSVPAGSDSGSFRRRPALVPAPTGALACADDGESCRNLILRPPRLDHGSTVALPATRRPWYSIIVDGIHAHPFSVTMARAAHPAGFVLVTDGMAALGLACGAHSLGDMRVMVARVDAPKGGAGGAGAASGSPSGPPHAEAGATASGADGSDDDGGGGVGDEESGGSTASQLPPAGRGSFKREPLDGAGECADPGRIRAVLLGTDTLAGAVLPLDACVRNLHSFTRCSRAEALAAATSRPAQALGEHTRRGRLLPGLRADMVLMHPATLQPLQTWVAGQPAWTRADGITTDPA